LIVRNFLDIFIIKLIFLYEPLEDFLSLRNRLLLTLRHLGVRKFRGFLDLLTIYLGLVYRVLGLLQVLEKSFPGHYAFKLSLLDLTRARLAL
jgi:hypothetical protein